MSFAIETYTPSIFQRAGQILLNQPPKRSFHVISPPPNPYGSTTENWDKLVQAFNDLRDGNYCASNPETIEYLFRYNPNTRYEDSHPHSQQSQTLVEINHQLDKTFGVVGNETKKDILIGMLNELLPITARLGIDNLKWYEKVAACVNRELSPDAIANAEENLFEVSKVDLHEQIACFMAWISLRNNSVNTLGHYVETPDLQINNSTSPFHIESLIPSSHELTPSELDRSLTIIEDACNEGILSDNDLRQIYTILDQILRSYSVPKEKPRRTPDKSTLSKIRKISKKLANIAPQAQLEGLQEVVEICISEGDPNLRSLQNQELVYYTVDNLITSILLTNRSLSIDSHAQLAELRVLIANLKTRAQKEEPKSVIDSSLNIAAEHSDQIQAHPDPQISETLPQSQSTPLTATIQSEDLETGRKIIANRLIKLKKSLFGEQAIFCVEDQSAISELNSKIDILNLDSDQRLLVTEYFNLDGRGFRKREAIKAKLPTESFERLLNQVLRKIRTTVSA